MFGKIILMVAHIILVRLLIAYSIVVSVSMFAAPGSDRL